MNKVSFEKLPEAVTMLRKEIGELKSLIIESRAETNSEQTEKLLTVDEAAEFLSLTVPTIYSKVSKRELPFMKRGKRLYFSSSELMEYLKQGRKKSNAEIEREAEAYLSNNKKGLKL